MSEVRGEFRAHTVKEDDEEDRPSRSADNLGSKPRRRPAVDDDGEDDRPSRRRGKSSRRWESVDEDDRDEDRPRRRSRSEDDEEDKPRTRKPLPIPVLETQLPEGWAGSAGRSSKLKQH